MRFLNIKKTRGAKDDDNHDDDDDDVCLAPTKLFSPSKS